MEKIVPDEIFGCKTKRALPSKNEAKHVISRMNRQLGIVEGVTLAPYKCPFCGSWHIGNQKNQGGSIVGSGWEGGKLRARVKGRGKLK